MLHDCGSSKLDFKTIKKPQNFLGLEKHAHIFSWELLYWNGKLHVPTSCRGKTKKMKDLVALSLCLKHNKQRKKSVWFVVFNYLLYNSCLPVILKLLRKNMKQF